MRQLTFIKKGLVEWHDVAEPRLAAPVQAIVRPFVAARCDGDCLPLFRSVTSLVNAGIALHFLDPLVTDQSNRLRVAIHSSRIFQMSAIDRPSSPPLFMIPRDRHCWWISVL